jgi:hypothetical protein
MLLKAVRECHNLKCQGKSATVLSLAPWAVQKQVILHMFMFITTKVSIAMISKALFGFFGPEADSI